MPKMMVCAVTVYVLLLMLMTTECVVVMVIPLMMMRVRAWMTMQVSMLLEFLEYALMMMRAMLRVWLLMLVYEAPPLRCALAHLLVVEWGLVRASVDASAWARKKVGATHSAPIQVHTSMWKCVQIVRWMLEMKQSRGQNQTGKEKRQSR
jgi:hypothetical protein